MNVFQKLFTRSKLFMAVISIIVEILIGLGNIEPDVKTMIMRLVALFGGGYIAVEGLADVVARLKTVYKDITK